MSTLRRAGIALVAVAGLAILAGCSAGAASSTASASTYNKNAQPPVSPTGLATLAHATPGSGTGLTVGFTQLLLASPFVQDVQKGVEAEAKTAGLTLLTCDSKGVAANALNCVKQFKTQNVNGLITFQGDASSSPAICAAGPQVPVIAVDIAQAPCQTSFMGTPNEYAGEIDGYNVGKYFGQNYNCQYDAFISLESKAVGEVNTLRMGGIRKGFESVCGKIHDLHILDTGVGGQAADAQTAVSNTLTALPGKHKIIVVGINEDVVVGALAAARAAGRTNDLYLAPQGLDPKNCQILGNKNWIGSTEYFPEKYGELLVPNIIKLMKHETVPSQILMPDVFINRANIKQYYPDFSC